MSHFSRVASLKTLAAFRARLEELGISLPLSDRDDLATPLAEPLEIPDERLGNFRVGNRFAILPMEGWDGELDGSPSELTRRRWLRFGASGAKLLWGGEAVAVRADGRANPNQLLLTEQTLPALAQMREATLVEHRTRYGSSDDLLFGLQLTHSGRFSRPLPSLERSPGTLRPRTAYAHPYLDPMFPAGPGDSPILSDDELDRLVDEFVEAAERSHRAGFQFVDIKHCHSYLGQELLSAVDRPGKYGGSLENRWRFLRDIIIGIRQTVPGMRIGVRLNIFDTRPFVADSETGKGVAVPLVGDRYGYAFGADASGLSPDLSEPIELIAQLERLGVRLICTTLGSPYYSPHLLRPAAFPPSDGYRPPEDPLVGVARHIQLTAAVKRRFPKMVLVGSGYTYLQHWLPAVASAAVAQGLVDSVGLGRMVLSYPELPADVLAGRAPAAKQLCRTFSDCTTGPRNGMISGCFPLDPFYHQRPEAAEVLRLRPKTGG